MTQHDTSDDIQHAFLCVKISPFVYQFNTYLDQVRVKYMLSSWMTIEVTLGFYALDLNGFDLVDKHTDRLDWSATTNSRHCDRPHNLSIIKVNDLLVNKKDSNSPPHTGHSTSMSGYSFFQLLRDRTRG